MDKVHNAAVYCKIILTVLLFFLQLGLTSCCSNFQARALDAPIEALEMAVEAAAADHIFDAAGYMPENWWTLFNDDQLTEFIELTLQRNPTLHTARGNIYLAMANTNRVRANLWPNLNWGADVSRQKFSETGIIPFNTNPLPGNVPIAATGGVNGVPVYFTQYETEFTLTYDFDFWGKNRNTWKAFLSEVKARIADEAFLRLSLGVAVSEVYFDLQVFYKRQEIAKAYENNKTRYLEYIQQRIDANIENALNLSLAEINLASAKQSLLEIQREIAVKEHLLKSYIAGNFEEEVCQLNIMALTLPKVPLPQDIPLHLISRRPDIVAQLWMIESAGKQIEVARAGFYPDFNLTALFGFQTIHLAKLFEARSSFYDIDPAVSLPIFDAGRLQANLRGSEVNYDLAIFHYNELILQSAREVLDGIAVLRNVNEQRQEYMQAANYQENYYKLTSLRKEHHLNSSLDTLTSEGTFLIAKDQEVAALGKTIQAMLSLIKALGGGYEACCNEG